MERRRCELCLHGRHCHAALESLAYVISGLALAGDLALPIDVARSISFSFDRQRLPAGGRGAEEVDEPIWLLRSQPEAVELFRLQNDHGFAALFFDALRSLAAYLAEQLTEAGLRFVELPYGSGGVGERAVS